MSNWSRREGDAGGAAGLCDGPRIAERAAHPKHIEILDELPKTAVGKVFKPDLRRRAITRVYNARWRSTRSWERAPCSSPQWLPISCPASG
jgi:hypothetical protein